MIDLFKTTFRDWLDDDCPQMAAALSYYTLFSLPPLLLGVVGLVVEPAEVQGLLSTEVRSVLEPEAAGQISAIVENAGRPDTGGPLVLLMSLAALLIGATGVLTQLQTALNRAWEVQPDPERTGWKVMLKKRFLSLGMILALAFVMLVSLALSTILGALGTAIAHRLPDGLSGPMLMGLNQLLTLAAATVLFAAIFRFLPDARVSWRDVWLGAFGTGVLMVLGKLLLGLWLGRSSPGEAFGAVGSLALLLVWVYYSSMLFFFGAEFTQAWAVRHGRRIQPEEGAVRINEDR